MEVFKREAAERERELREEVERARRADSGELSPSEA